MIQGFMRIEEAWRSLRFAMRESMEWRHRPETAFGIESRNWMRWHAFLALMGLEQSVKFLLRHLNVGAGKEHRLGVLLRKFRQSFPELVSILGERYSFWCELKGESGGLHSGKSFEDFIRDLDKEKYHERLRYALIEDESDSHLSKYPVDAWLLLDLWEGMLYLIDHYVREVDGVPTVQSERRGRLIQEDYSIMYVSGDKEGEELSERVIDAREKFRRTGKLEYLLLAREEAEKLRKHNATKDPSINGPNDPTRACQDLA